MPSFEREKEILSKAIERYDHPKKTNDFSKDNEIQHSNMRSLEKTIKDDLVSENLVDVKNGLSNVIFWGYYQMNNRDFRVERFRDNVTEKKLEKCTETFPNLSGIGIRTLKNLELPEFSQLPFLSKIRMFLAPEKYVVLDNKLMKLASVEPYTLFHDIKKDKTTIRVTKENERIYQKWCEFCRKVADKLFKNREFFTVDIERGIFQLVKENKLKKAAKIVYSLAKNYE